VYAGTGFYLIPFKALDSAETSLTQCKHFWEAWREVLGLPMEISNQVAEAELHQIEMMWEQSP
jgi:predicted solute-binding protein